MTTQTQALGPHLDPHDQHVSNRDVPLGTPTVPAFPIQPTVFKNQIILLAQLSPENPNEILDRYFKFDGKIYRRNASGIVRLHERFIPAPSTIVSPDLVEAGSTFSIGDRVFSVANWGGLFKFGDAEPVEVFDNEAVALASVGISMSPPHLQDLQGNLAPATPTENGVLDPGIGQAAPELPSPGTTPFLSPASSDSSTSQSSLGSGVPDESSSLFIDICPGSVAPSPAASDPLSPPTTSPSDEQALKIKSEIDAYVDSLKVGRKRRGPGPSLFQLRCLWCDKFNPKRRPAELKVSGGAAMPEAINLIAIHSNTCTAITIWLVSR
ncbi:hypothetical protein FRC10_006250 [Ceratobasidium sp. 414]|nr:hypothetical protein FRC10_006250 [Ceratobasidium sp. 414]